MVPLATICLLLALNRVYSYPEEENPNLDGSLFAGDMKLTPEQLVSVLNGGDISARSSYAAMRDVGILWYPNRVMFYDIVPELEAIAPATLGIMKAFREWEERSCLSFKRRTTEPDYVEMFGTGGGCWSYVGRQGGMQQMSLEDGCWGVGTIVHEIGHAVGFGHEQNRPDRDQYIEVLMQNVPPRKQHNFRKYTNVQVDSLNSPYDYRSFMQYSKRSFGINGSITLNPRQPDVFQLGQRVGFTDSDQYQAMHLYRCNGKTTRKTPTFDVVKLPGKHDCTFENGMCHFVQESGDDFDWTRRIGGTPSWGTGPETDHTTQRIGTFLYIEASVPRKKGDVARLRTRRFANIGGPRCLSFFHHQFSQKASHMGSFRVLIKGSRDEQEKVIFELTGSSGINDWVERKVNYVPTSEYEMIFEATRGNDYQGDIAIDDVSFSNGPCTRAPKASQFKAQGPCSDVNDREAQYCKQWKDAGFCVTQEKDMRKFCSKTCAFC